jgi:hypothetical protein
VEFTVENIGTDLAPTKVEGSIVDRVDLPSGGFAILRDPVQLRAKDKKRVLKNIQDAQRAVAAGVDVVDGMVMMLVEKWELPYLPMAALPADEPEILDELTIPDYDALVQAVGPAQKVLFPGPVTVDDMGKPGSPTQPASA